MFSQYLNSEDSRQTGRTEALVEWARKSNGTIVCHNLIEVRRIKKQYGVNAVSIQVLRLDPHNRGPLMFDSQAVVEMEDKYIERVKYIERQLDKQAHEKDSEIIKLEEEVKALKLALEESMTQIEVCSRFIKSIRLNKETKAAFLEGIGIWKQHFKNILKNRGIYN
jgi:cysteinyl-tRNA synthetase